MERKDFEIMAPVGSPECLAAALRAGADSIYFGIENLNMRAHSASTFSIDDLKRIAEECRLCGVKSYLTVNTIIYGEDLPLMRQILDAAKEANISAVIASDIAVMSYCKQIGQEVHLSTQLNISNIEALRFYAQFADVVVLARELNMDQVAEIYRRIQEENICGPKGELIRIEMFCHGALCMAISGKCYLSESNWGRSANRGECMQLCRRRYTVKDAETGTELDIENKYIMSPRDLKTISFLDRLMDSGVRVMKIEGRARGPEYVDTVVRCYNEAIEAVLHDKTHPEETPQFTEDQKAKWDERLSRVFGSLATEKKMYCGKVVRYFSKLGVAEFKIEACELNKDDEIMVTGPTTGCLRLTANEIRNDDGPVDTAKKGWYVSISTEGTKVRRNDKLFRIIHNT